MSSQQPRIPGDAAVWIILCAFLNCLGWLLSAFHQLNAAGYLVALAIAIGAPWVIRKVQSGAGEAVETAKPMGVGGPHWPKAPGLMRGVDFSCGNLHKLRRRSRRLFPLCFFLLAALAFLGGLLYAPNNYDALAYRTPRVLHWLAEGRWHWIHTDFGRLNVRSCGVEWVTAPLLALTHSDRGIFLISIVSFLMLPGRVFSVLTRLGVSGRVAWYWMWIFPTGYCFLLQAGSIGNDVFGATVSLLAIEFALRAAQSGRFSEAGLSVLAAALMTAAKAFNLLLLLPWGLAMLPCLRLLLRRPVATGALLVVATATSFIPTAILNLHYCRDWTGNAAEHFNNYDSHDKLFHIVVNGLLLCLQNLTPPIFPWASGWNHLMNRTIPAPLAEKLQHYFETFAAQFRVGEMEIEERASIGVGVTVLFVIWTVHRLLSLGRAGAGRGKGSRADWLIPLGAGIATLVFMSRTGLACPGRYLGVFFLLLFAPFFAHVPASATIIRYRWFRHASLAVFVMGGLLLVVTPARPLWPAQTILRAFGAEHSSHALVRRAWTVYSVYGGRGDAFAQAKAILPPDANPLGVVTSDDPETSLWRPFGKRRIFHICNDDGPEKTREKDVRYGLVSSVVLGNCNTSLNDWLAHHDAELLQKMHLELRASDGPKEWYLVRFRWAEPKTTAGNHG